MTTQATRAGQAATEAALKDLMTAGLDGDSAAHAAMLRRITPLLRSFFARRMRDGAADLDDLVQEALIAVHTRRESFDRGRAFTPWLYSLARHKLVDHFRRNANHLPVEGLEEILAVEGFERQSNAHMDVNRLLDTLSAKQARAIRQTKIEGMSVAEVAAQSGLSISDVKVSVHRGLKTLPRSVTSAQAVPLGRGRA